MNRKQRRKQDVEDLLRADVNLRNLLPTPFEPGRRGTRSFSVVAKTDFELWAQLIFGALHTLGVKETPHIVGFFLDFLNAQPPNIRRLLAAGIIDGLGMTILQEAGEAGEVVFKVSLDPKFEPLVKQQAQRAGRLWVPGDDIPGPPVVH
jgi:hypothetical protein